MTSCVLIIIQINDDRFWPLNENIWNELGESVPTTKGIAG